MEDVIRHIPDWKHFFTIKEHEDSTDDFAGKNSNARVRVLGCSRDGRPIRSISLGSGNRDIVLVGFPHPNEPVGALMLEYLLTVLAEEDFGFCWHVIKCVDPDGARLNEGWFSREYDLRNHIYNYYRSPSYLQVDWTFPVRYKTHSFNDPLPETCAFKSLLDETKPVLLYSLHNSTFGGVYWYLTERCPSIYPRLHAACERQGLPLYLGEPEVPYAITYDRAIYEAFTIEDEYEYLAKNSSKDPAKLMKAGTSSDHYAKRFGTFSVVCEVPYLFHPKVADYNTSHVKRSESVMRRLEEEKAFFKTMKGLYERMDNKNVSSPFLPPLRHYLDVFEGFHEADVKWASGLSGHATEAELFDDAVLLPFHNTLLLGELFRLAEESDFGGKEAFKQEISGMIEERISEFESNCRYTAIPLKKIVAVQLETLFACLDFLKSCKKN